MNKYKKAGIVGLSLLGVYVADLARRTRVVFVNAEEVESIVHDAHTDHTGHASMTSSDLYRNFAYDAGIQDPESVIKHFADDGYNPPSEEGAEKLREDSNARKMAIAQLIPLIDMQATFAAACFVELYSRANVLTDNEKMELMVTYSAFAHSLLIGSYAGVKSLGLLRG